MQTKATQDLRRLIAVAVFGAMAYAVMLLIHFPVSFLTLDVKDAVITLCGLYFGPVGALAIGILVPLLELVTVSGTGLYGLIMNILGTLSFALPASIIYRYRKTFAGAIIGILSGIFAMTAVMMIANLIVTPYFMGVETAQVAKMLPTLFLPFNLVKAVLNAAIVLLVYKPLSGALRRAGVLRGSPAPAPIKTYDDAAANEMPAETYEAPTETYDEPPAETDETPAETGGMPAEITENAAPAPEAPARRHKLRSVLVTVIALALIAASLLVIFLVLKGEFRFGLKD